MPVAGARHPSRDHLGRRRAPWDPVEEVLACFEPTRVAGPCNAVPDPVAPERHVAEVVPAHHVARMPHGRAPQATAPAQGPQTVCPPLSVLDAKDRSRETLDAHARLMRLVTRAGSAHGVLPFCGRRMTHQQRKRDQERDEETENDACAISNRHERATAVRGAGPACPTFKRGWPSRPPVKLEVGPEGARNPASPRNFRGNQVQPVVRGRGFWHYCVSLTAGVKGEARPVRAATWPLAQGWPSSFRSR